MRRTHAALIWASLAAAVAVPIIAAAASPLLAWRDPVYIAAGFAGVVAMALLLVQPLLAIGYLPGLAAKRGRRAHRVTGSFLVIATVTHVVGLWITSPPDVIDALLFRAPTPFSFWGVVAMWTIFATALLAVLRRRFRLITWRRGHSVLGLVVVLCSAVHAILIEGTMEPVSKTALCVLALAATIKAVADLRVFAKSTTSR